MIVVNLDVLIECFTFLVSQKDVPSPEENHLFGLPLTAINVERAKV